MGAGLGNCAGEKGRGRGGVPDRQSYPLLQ